MPLLIFRGTIKSRSSLHPGGPGKRVVKWLCVCVFEQLQYLQHSYKQCQGVGREIEHVMSCPVLTWVAGYIPRWFTHPEMVNHPSTNWDQSTVT